MNKEIIYIDDVVHEVRESKIDFTGVSEGAHVLKIEKYKNDVLQDTVTRNIVVEASGGTDDTVAAFLSATGITDPTISYALNDLVTTLKTEGLFSKCKAIYPLVGGTAERHSYNLVDPTQFKITWYGTINHAATGVTGNAANGYGNTGFVENDFPELLNNNHVITYLRTVSPTTNTNDIGATSSDYANGVHIMSSFGGNARSVLVRNQNASYKNIVATENIKFAGTTRNSSDSFSVMNNSFYETYPISSTADLCEYPYTVCARNRGGTIDSFSDNEQVFASTGEGLTEAEMNTYKNAIAQFQTDLGR